jgi:hypothetical protein
VSSDTPRTDAEDVWIDGDGLEQLDGWADRCKRVSSFARQLERELAAAQRAERALAAARAIIQEQADPEGEIYCWFEPVHIEEGLLQQELARLTKAIRG